MRAKRGLSKPPSQFRNHPPQNGPSSFSGKRRGSPFWSHWDFFQPQNLKILPKKNGQNFALKTQKITKRFFRPKFSQKIACPKNFNFWRRNLRQGCRLLACPYPLNLRSKPLYYHNFAILWGIHVTRTVFCKNCCFSPFFKKKGPFSDPFLALKFATMKRSRPKIARKARFLEKLPKMVCKSRPFLTIFTKRGKRSLSLRKNL